MLTQEEKRRLASSSEFQKILSEDPILKDIESQERASAENFLMLMPLLGIKRSIGSKKVSPPTAALWSFLRATGSPFACHGKSIELSDCDIFLYLLEHGYPKDTDGLPALPGKASGTCAAAGLNAEEAAALLGREIDLAFKPLEVLPRDAENTDGPSSSLRDAEWLAMICSAAAKESGSSTAFARDVMSLEEVCLHYVNRRRAIDGKAYRRAPDTHAAHDILARVEKLGKDFLNGTDSASGE